MADSRHVDLVLEGPPWAALKKELVVADLRLDLAGADLARQKLVGLPLGKANLKGARLAGADLTGAWLTGAFMQHANLEGATLVGADLTGADLRKADLTNAKLCDATLTNAELSRSILNETHFEKANLERAKLDHTLGLSTYFTSALLPGADLRESNLIGADFTEANLFEANLASSVLVRANIQNADLTSSRVYGASVWDVKGQPASQVDLVITPPGLPEITVDDIRVAQFVHLLLDNRNLRNVIETIGNKGVLILGRFTKERKHILDSLRSELRRHNFVPMMFDFERSENRDFTETIMTLTGMCLFVIVDITNPRSSPLELQATVPNYMIPFVPILQEGEQPFTMFADLKKYHWVLDVLLYDNVENLLKVSREAIIVPALEKHKQLLLDKTEQVATRHVREFLGSA